MDGKPIQINGNSGTNRDEVKAWVKSGKAFRIVRDEIRKTYESPEGEFYVEVIASSDQEDLVGDVMTMRALQIMERDFVGKTVFLNHRTNVPDDVFGSIVSAELQKTNGVQLLVLNIVVEKENEPAMKTWRIINGDRTKLGTSVTVLVKAHKPNPNRKGGMLIDDVETIEHSIVGVPCNRESLTMTATASKALALYEATDDMETVATATTETDIPVEKTADTAAVAPAVEASEAATETAEQTSASTDETPAEVVDEPVVAETDTVAAEAPTAEDVAEPSAETVEEAVAAEEAPSTKAFPRTAAMIEKIKQIRAIAELDSTVKVEAPAVAVKGMFNDKKDHPSFWDLVDILCEVRWSLQWRLDSVRNDESEVAEVLSLYAEAFDEFKIAALDSFTFWNDIDTEKAASFTAADIENAIELEKGLAHVAELTESVANTEAAEQMRTIGKNLVEIAAKMGIPMPTGISDITQHEDFQAVATLAKHLGADNERLEKELAEMQANYEGAKAGLAAAVEAIDTRMREPLTVVGSN